MLQECAAQVNGSLAAFVVRKIFILDNAWVERDLEGGVLCNVSYSGGSFRNGH